jgi:hypothetical protein
MKRLLAINHLKPFVFVICFITFAFSNLTITAPNYTQAESGFVNSAFVSNLNILQRIVDIQGQPQINTGNFVVYCNPDSKIGIDHPSSWDIQESPNTPTVVDFVSPLEDNSDKIQESIRVQSAYYPPSNPTNAPKPEEAAATRIQFLKQNVDIQDVKFVASKAAEIGDGRPAYYVVYTFKDRLGNNLVGYDIFFNGMGSMQNDIIYAIHFEGEAPKFDAYSPILLRMANSFNENCLKLTSDLQKFPS